MRGVRTRLTTGPFDPCGELRLFIEERAGDGAVASFIGLTRDGRDGEAVEALVLEHYSGVTERSLQEIAEDGVRRFRLSAALVVHRAGRILPGEAIVLVAAAAPHRRAAFDGVDYLMDRLKTDAAFWKREEGPHATRWIEPIEADRDARHRWD